MPQTHQISVHHVVDGDTITGTYGWHGHRVRIRLHGIDAPEMDQPHGPAARDALARMLGSSCVMTVVAQRDDYGRTVAILHSPRGGIYRSHNIAMVREGWAYPAYLRETDPRLAQHYRDAERSAHDNRLGVWRDSSKGGVRPWIWRRERRRSRVPATKHLLIIALAALTVLVIIALLTRFPT